MWVKHAESQVTIAEDAGSFQPVGREALPGLTCLLTELSGYCFRVKLKVRRAGTWPSDRLGPTLWRRTEPQTKPRTASPDPHRFAMRVRGPTPPPTPPTHISFFNGAVGVGGGYGPRGVGGETRGQGTVRGWGHGGAGGLDGRGGGRRGVGGGDESKRRSRRGGKAARGRRGGASGGGGGGELGPAGFGGGDLARGERAGQGSWRCG